MITFEKLLERAKSELIAIHTPTAEQMITLLKALDEKGYEWASGEKLTTKTRYEDFREFTCYDFGIDVDGNVLDKKITYSPLDWYQSEGYTIIEFKDIDFKENA